LRRILINSSLNGFILLDEIKEVRQGSILAVRTFHNDPLYLGIEALAQLGAYHMRFKNDFARHAFLLKINLFQVVGDEILDGKYFLEGAIGNQSSTTYSYNLTARKGSEYQTKGQFLFAMREYDEKFTRKKLETRYRRQFLDLCLERL